MFHLPQAPLPSPLEYIISSNRSDIKSWVKEKKRREEAKEREKGKNQWGKEGNTMSNNKKQYNIKTAG